MKTNLPQEYCNKKQITIFLFLFAELLNQQYKTKILFLRIISKYHRN